MNIVTTWNINQSKRWKGVCEKREREREGVKCSRTFCIDIFFI